MMSEQLVIYLDHYDSDYSWCLKREDGTPSERQRGDTQALAESLGAGNHQALLILGGPQVAMRQLAYSEQEKKHLKRLMPFQLEEAVIGDISQFHFALGQPKEGQVALAYTEKSRLKALFTELAEANIEIIRCVPAALLLPLPADEDGQPHGWALHKMGSEILVRHGECTGFSVSQNNVGQTLSLLLTAENRVDQLPALQLSAASEAELTELRAALPTAFESATIAQQVSDIHLLSPANDAVNLCQGEFSQRLPVERWWRAGRGLIIGAGVALVVYIGTLLLGIYQLQQDNLDTRRAIEQVFRTVVASGPANDPERRLNIMLRDLQPDVGGTAAVPLLAQVLPQIPDTVTVRGIHYTANDDELNLNLQAGTFNAIETLRSEIANSGLGAELLSASAQGNTHSARLRITRAMP